MRSPGPLLAAGRECDIYEYGPALVLRRSREGRSQAEEARMIDYLSGAGYPVPRVDEVSDDGMDLVMERIEGPSMVDWLTTHPWAVRRQGRILADLHHRLHAIPPPDFLQRRVLGPGGQLLHMDLHPLNVLVSARGPVVIDWANTSLGDGAVDVAIAWVLMNSGQIPGGRLLTRLLGAFRGLLVGGFVSQFDLEPVKAKLREVVEWKVQDAHMSDAERASMWRLVDAG